MNAPQPASLADTRRLTFAVTGVSVATALVLTVLKLAVWASGGSVALLASLADSGLDVVAALATFVAVRVAAAPPDEEHRFGHGKAEAFSSLLQAGLVFASAALVGQEAVHRLLHPAAPRHEAEALLVMLVSLLATVVLVTAQSWILNRARSVAVSGDRAHYLADLASNLAAILGIGLAALTRDPRFDAAAGLVVSLWLLWGAVKVFREAGDHLMDRELDAVERQAIVDSVMADPQILGVHDLRTHASGPGVRVQMHVELAADLSLMAAHFIVDAAEARVLAAFPTADVIIHPDPAGVVEAVAFGYERPSAGASGPSAAA